MLYPLVARDYRDHHLAHLVGAAYAQLANPMEAVKWLRRAADWGFAPTPTPGAPNAIAVEEDVVINEVMYNPFQSRNGAGQPFEARPGEFIELHNPGTAPRSLAGLSVSLVNGATSAQYASIDLSPAMVLPAGGYLVVHNPAVMIDPAAIFCFRVSSM